MTKLKYLVIFVVFICCSSNNIKICSKWSLNKICNGEKCIFFNVNPILQFYKSGEIICGSDEFTWKIVDNFLYLNDNQNSILKSNIYEVKFNTNDSLELTGEKHEIYYLNKIVE